MGSYRVKIEAEVELDYLVEADSQRDAINEAEAMADAGDLPMELTTLARTKTLKPEKVPD